MTAKNSPTRTGAIQAPLRIKSSAGGRLKSGKETCTVPSRVNLLDSAILEYEKEKP